MNTAKYPDRPEVSGAELVERARALVPALRERARAAEETGRIPDETVEDLKAADLFRAVVPKRFGGHEVDFKYIPQIFRELGRGCTSTAWTMGFLIYHNFQFAHFSEAAQEDAWGDKGYTMAPGQVMPAGSAEPIEGGFELSGRWGYATGIQHGDWMLLSAPLAGDGAGQSEVPDVRRFFLPVSDFTVLDTWHVSAMRATGSHDVTLDKVFVPEHRMIRVSDLRAGTAPGLALNTGPLWRVPLLTLMCYGAVGPMVGGAEAMLELVTGILKDKVGAYTGRRQQDLMPTRIRLADNKTKLEATRGLYDAKIQLISDTVNGGGQLSPEDRAEARLVVSYIARTCRDIVVELALMAGSRAVFLDSPIQRFQRDINSLATHAVFDFDHTADLYGGVMMGTGLPAGAMI
ncbi:MAG: acyl-CoA dehydrogenase family protein [Rhodospirillales bacterium]|jgi:alkylation response protein AidB-like acyl-CoA dehydrogenase|nr:acyl-CoA dehydrogenase family protein [Rhodospirillales bacterium]MDP6644922.1 acyl-CoA dehydrogenase family protein [Rhodospirillales bacterium]MDP6841366.1 acyl-CoA dehydrogenase family protein [Rhodospirillales bacterium]